ncbi:uncharacterized protein LOC115209496 [Octopus sinensis]|uniref:Uncharacterized protein LOC115209496 n=1 Tax=Octopus sinensis TaxID=2607531 RepID=A0A7E6EPG6_9MOLL|nr:uncharacterized protein LOC115209496 [Octopus sinensis]
MRTYKQVWFSKIAAQIPKMKNLSFIAAVAVIATLCLGIAGNPSPTMPPPLKTCENAVADVMFVLDESGSVGSNNYKKMKEFVNHIVKSFPIGPKHVRVGAIRFAKVTTPQFALNSYNDKNLVLKGINSIPYRGGNTKTHKALNYLRTTSFTQAAGDRKDAPNIAIILTDGKSNNQRETITAARKLRNANVIVFAIGIGNNLNELELKEIGNSPTDKYVFTVKDFDALKSIESELIKKTCEADPCDAKPCKNSGVCKSKGNSYTCTCKTGYSGENCDKVDPCAASPCKNGGVCESNGNSYKCTCKAGYSGTNCDTVDPCAASPCKNGGVCESNGNSYKCTCKAGYSGTNCDTVDPCAANPCKNGGECKSNGNSYKCTCKAGYSGTNCDTVIPDCVCKVSGDPHYATFDGQLIHFMGTCKYTLASTTKGSSLMAFSVEAKNEHRFNNKKVSYIRMVDVKVNGVTLRLLPGHTVLVNKQIFQMPLKNFLVFDATYSAGWVTVTTTFGLKVKFDGNHRVYIYVSGKYRGQLTGLCGDCNSKRDDFRTKEGVDVSKKANKYSLIGKSYQVPDDSDKPEKVCNVTDITTDCDLKITGVCELMTHENGIFGQCVKSLGKEVARQYLDSCKIDVCAYSMTAKYKKSATCKSFESFVKECEAKDVLVNWRGVLGCQLDCSTWANTMYKFNVSDNQPTCMNRNPTPTAYLTDGCICKGNYVLSGKECVPISQCGCMYSGTYLKANTTILSSDCSVSVTCLGNGKIHESSSCPSGSDCLIEFGQRMCKCPDGYAPLNGECKKTLKPPPPPIIDPAFLQPVMHMFIRVSVAYIKGTFLEELKFEHVEKCAHRCMNNTKCKSFNFDDLVKTCQLYSISAATGITLTPSECPYREYYQRIDSKTVVIYGATITTCIHISEYSNIKTEAECKKLRIKGNYTAMEYSKFFKGCGVTHNAEKTYGLTGNIFWKFERTYLFYHLPSNPVVFIPLFCYSEATFSANSLVHSFTCFPQALDEGFNKLCISIGNSSFMHIISAYEPTLSAPEQEDYVANSITEFRYEPDEGVTFEVYYRRYEQIFNKECKDWDDDIKTRLSLKKLAAGEHKHYSNYVLSKTTSDISFKKYNRRIV